jgi:hypothetical protein
MFKGTWYYEIQILMFVFMWRHTDIGANHPKGLTIGRFHVWCDTAWTMHGIAGKVRNAILDYRYRKSARNYEEHVAQRKGG